MGVVTPLNNPGGPEGDTVTVAEKLLNTEYREIEKEKGDQTMSSHIHLLPGWIRHFRGPSKEVGDSPMNT